MKFFAKPKEAYATDLLERPVEGDVKIEGNAVRFNYRANAVGTILVKF